MTAFVRVSDVRSANNVLKIKAALGMLARGTEARKYGHMS